MIILEPIESMHTRTPIKSANRSDPSPTTDLLVPEIIPIAPFASDFIELAIEDKRNRENKHLPKEKTKTELNEENREQHRAFQLWYRQHVSGLFKADQVDASVAQAVKKDISHIRRWKIAYGWAKRLENIKKEEKAEEKLLLFAKNEAIEHDSLDVVLKYLAYIQSLDPSKIEAHHVKMMMQLVEFSQKNKTIMEPPGQTLNAAGVSLTIQQN